MPKMQGLLTWLREVAQDSPLPPGTWQESRAQRGGPKRKS